MILQAHQNQRHNLFDHRDDLHRVQINDYPNQYQPCSIDRNLYRPVPKQNILLVPFWGQSQLK